MFSRLRPPQPPRFPLGTHRSSSLRPKRNSSSLIFPLNRLTTLQQPLHHPFSPHLPLPHTQITPDPLLPLYHTLLHQPVPYLLGCDGSAAFSGEGEGDSHCRSTSARGRAWIRCCVTFRRARFNANGEVIASVWTEFFILPHHASCLHSSCANSFRILAYLILHPHRVIALPRISGHMKGKKEHTCPSAAIRGFFIGGSCLNI